jgi:choline kinase
MKNENIEIYKSEDLSTSVERYERSIRFIENNAELVLTTSQKGLETIANTAVSLGGIYRDLKQMEYSFQMYMKNAENNLVKINNAQKQLEGMQVGINKFTDRILSYDINLMEPEQIKFRSDLLNTLNMQIDGFVRISINVFNC